MAKVDILPLVFTPDDVELAVRALLRHIAMGKKPAFLTSPVAGWHPWQRRIKNNRGKYGGRMLVLSLGSNWILRMVFCQWWNASAGNYPKNQAVSATNCFVQCHQWPAPWSRAVSKTSGGGMFLQWTYKSWDISQWGQSAGLRPKAVYHYIQDNYIHPDFVIDITDFIEIKHVFFAFSSQFYSPIQRNPETPISGKEFIEALDAKMALWGRQLMRYAEGFSVNHYPGVNSLFDLI